MFNRIALHIFILILLVSCKDQVQKKDAPSLIDREKIDAAFGKHVSAIMLNHLYIVLDSLSYSSLIKDTEWSKTFGALDKGLPSFAPIDNDTPMCYLRGHKHYIEILGPNNIFNEPVGKSGVGFTLENDDEHFHLGVKPKLKVENTRFLNATKTVDMELSKQKGTWFKAFYTPSPGTALHTWYAFYNPIFLDSLYQKHHTFYSREAFLKPNYANQKLFNGIKSIVMTCTTDDYIRITQELYHLGCKLLERDGQMLSIDGGDIIIKITTSNEIEYSQITQIRCHLNRSDDSVTNLGNVTIVNKGKESIWSFDNLHKNNF
ncbi:DUF5829 family protein [Aquimarina macrocephali]|uniref:DUF5829 family protein n=1 Tax=Aquimarina macrocephali TaxID=666563 RepID=UPI0004664B7C|nr:DUF5829 family protein [Aquimarina macrocephali]